MSYIYHLRRTYAAALLAVLALSACKKEQPATTPAAADYPDFMEAVASDFGSLTALRHAGQLSDTPPLFVHPPVRLGTHAAVWP